MIRWDQPGLQAKRKNLSTVAFMRRQSLKKKERIAVDHTKKALYF